MPEIEIFLDSSALIAGIVSAHGASRALLLLSEDEKITLKVTEQVIAEVERNIARKAPKALPFVRQIILSAKIVILHDPTFEAIQEYRDWITHKADLPILVAAAHAKVDFLVTLDTHHFIENPDVSQRSGLRIGTPGDALAWIRNELSKATR